MRIPPTGTFSIPDGDADNICRKRFTFTADSGANLPLTPVESSYYVCTAAQSNPEALLGNTAITDGALVYLPDMCDDLSAGTLGGFVQFVSPIDHRTSPPRLSAPRVRSVSVYSLVLTGQTHSQPD